MRCFFTLTLFLFFCSTLLSQTCPVCTQSCSVLDSNLVYNGDFNIAAQLAPYNSSAPFPPAQWVTYCNSYNQYTIAPNAATFNGQWCGVDHTTGTGNFLICDGNGGTQTSAWGEDINISAYPPNTDFIFCAWVNNDVCSWANYSDPVLRLRLNGMLLTPPLLIPEIPDQWVLLSAVWNSGAVPPAVVTIEVVTTSTQSLGNDFGVDDISFAACIPPLTLGNGGPDVSFCAGDSALLNATGGSAYHWHPAAFLSDTTGANPFCSAPGSTQYTVDITLSNGCVITDTVNVFVNPSPVISLGNDTSICGAVSLWLNGSYPGASYLWSDNSANDSLLVTAGGSYWVETFLNGCQFADSILISQFPLPVIDLGNDTVLCPGTSVTLDAVTAGLVSYQWQDGSSLPDLTVSVAGNYWVTVSNGMCEATDSIQVSFFPPMNPDIGADTFFCENSFLTFSGNIAGANYLWSDGSQQSTLTVDTPGLFWVQAILNGCTSSDSVFITEEFLPQVQLPVSDTVLCFGNTFLIDAGENGTWQDGSVSETYLIDKAGTYYFTVSNVCGDASDTVTATYELCGCALYLPNAFSPNNDGINDLFAPIHGSCGISSYSMKIFNRWGQLLFQSSSPENGWNGTLDGVPQPVSTYIYFIGYSYKEENSLRQKMMKGNVTLIR